MGNSLDKDIKNARLAVQRAIERKQNPERLQRKLDALLTKKKLNLSNHGR